MQNLNSDVRNMWTQAFDITLTMQREAAESARDAAKANVAVQRAALRGVRAGMTRFANATVPAERVTEAAEAISRAVPGDRNTQETVKRSTAEAMRATLQAPMTSATQMAALTMEPYERMLDVMETQVETATNAWVAAATGAVQMNRTLTMGFVDSWMGTLAATEDAMRTNTGNTRASRGE